MSNPIQNNQSLLSHIFTPPLVQNHIADFDGDDINFDGVDNNEFISKRLHPKINTETRKEKIKRLKEEKKQRKQDSKIKSLNTPKTKDIFIHNDTGKIIDNTCKLIGHNYSGLITMDNGNVYKGSFYMYIKDHGYYLTMNGYGKRIVDGKYEEGFFEGHTLKQDINESSKI